MDHTQRHTGHTEKRGAEGAAPAFAAFVLAHDGCGAGPSEFRLDEDSLACWCPRCDELQIFGPVEGGGSTR